MLSYRSSSLAVAAATLFVNSAWAQPVLISAPATVGPSDTTIIDQASGQAVSLATAQITVRGTTLTMSGRHSIASLVIQRNVGSPGVLTHPAAAAFDYSGTGTDVVEGLRLTVTGGVSIEGSSGGVASRIDLNGRGFAGGAGPGAGEPSTSGAVGGTGGGHGGRGASSGVFAGGAAYDSAMGPTRLGSGGGGFVGTPGGAGGGAIKLDVQGTLTVDGSIEAAGLGGSVASGGGSGGSVWIVANTFAGGGSIYAGGGFATGWGGGAGGLVTVQYASSSFSGTLAAPGGTSPASGERGGAGVIVRRPNAQTYPDVIVAANESSGVPSAPTPVNTGGPWNSLTVSGVAQLATTSPFEVMHDATVQSSGRITLAVGENVVNGNLSLVGAGNSISNITGLLGTITVFGDLTLDAGSSFSGDARGFGPGAGPGAGTASTNGSFGAAGAGHGGRGGTSASFAGGAVYGSIGEPIDVGSGGGAYLTSPGGSGGGAFRIAVPNGTFLLNGSVSVAGTNGVSAAGSGSGGSAWISVNTLAGAGTIGADGGSGSGWGGGSGGRIAVEYATSTFTGLMHAFGGPSASGVDGGAAGTIYIKPDAQTNPDLIVDAGAGAAHRRAETTVAGDRTYHDVIDRGAANLRFTSPASVQGSVTLSGVSWLTLPTGMNTIGGDLLLSSAGNVVFSPAGEQLQLTVGNDVRVETGSAITSDGRGFAGGQGPGAGGASNNGGIGAAGGGHGGEGALALNFVGGTTYGSYSAPEELGSGGGAYVGNIGGAGGGAMRLIVGNVLTVDGVVSSNGVRGVSSSGCGAGGSVWIDAGSVAGAGTISADGGEGSSWGGGGGGRVAMTYDSSAFAGRLSAAGGNSPSSGQRGGAGTIALWVSGASNPDVIVDNFASSAPASAQTVFTPDGVLRSVVVAGMADCRFSEATTVESDVTVRSKGMLTMSLGDNVVLDDVIVVDAGSTLFSQPQQRLELFVGGDVNIGAGAAISATGRGFPGGQGPGRGTASTNGGIGAAGGGYGGAGASAGPFAGGTTYGSATQPLDLGSGGGSYVGDVAGAGGGAIKMTVFGALTVDGTLTAAGAQPPNSSGAGSGGSINIQASGVTGSGTINANGGSGGGGSWGAGGGGRVAVYSCGVTIPLANITASRGAAGNQPAQDGSVVFGASSITVTSQPPTLAVLSGLPLQFAVSATTSQPGGTVGYRWRKRDNSGEFIPMVDSGHINGTSTNTLTFTPSECEDAGVYDCLLTDSCGSFPSNACVITVDPIADYNHDGGVDGDDVIAFFGDWDAGLVLADINGDEGVDGDDVIFFFARWDIGC